MKQIGTQAFRKRQLSPAAIAAINHITAAIGEGAALAPYAMTLFVTNWNLANGGTPLALADALAKVNRRRGLILATPARSAPHALVATRHIPAIAPFIR